MNRRLAEMYLKTLGLSDGQRAPIGAPLIVSHAQWFNRKLQNVGSGDIEPSHAAAIFNGLEDDDVFIAAYLQNKTIEELVHGSGPSNSDRILLFYKEGGVPVIYQVLPLHWDEYAGRTRETYDIAITTLAYPDAVTLLKGLPFN